MYLSGVTHKIWGPNQQMYNVLGVNIKIQKVLRDKYFLKFKHSKRFMVIALTKARSAHQGCRSDLWLKPWQKMGPSSIWLLLYKQKANWHNWTKRKIRNHGSFPMLSELATGIPALHAMRPSQRPSIRLEIHGHYKKFNFLEHMLHFLQ